MAESRVWWVQWSDGGVRDMKPRKGGRAISSEVSFCFHALHDDWKEGMKADV